MNKNFYHGAIPSVMTIAGSDSGGGAGIQADLKTFSALRVFGTTAITSITSQNTVGVNDVYNIPIEHLESQMAAVFDDIDIMVVKTGMLATSDIISIVCSTLKKYNVSKLVVDPVMVAKDGSRLLQKQAMSALITELIPISYVITPNIPEAEDLVSMKISNIKDMYNAADKIYKGLINGSSFEIDFPKELTLILKFLKLLPDRIYFSLIKILTKYQKR